MMEWLDSLWAWVMSILASFLSLFTSVEKPLSHEEDLSDRVVSKTSEVLEAFAAQAAHVPPMVVELSEAPPNM